MSDWQLYRKLLWEHWERKMTGSLVVAFVLAVGGTIWQGAAYLFLFLFTLAVCLLIASYRVWKDEHRGSLVKEDRTGVGRSLAGFVGQGQKLKAEIQNSDDNVPTAQLAEKKVAWVRDVTGYLEAHVSPGRAMFFASGPAVLDMVVGGMRSQQTRHEKTAIYLAIDAHLVRLSEIMREY
jgi:hypothetical protein